MQTRKEAYDFVNSRTVEELVQILTAKELISLQLLLDPTSSKISGNKVYQATRCKDMVNNLRRSQKLLGIEI